MPLYEYVCSKCHGVSEHLLKFSDPTPSVCPLCEANETLSKKMSASAFHLKGGGWYADAYSSKPEASSSSSTSENAADAPKKDSKPEAKPSSETKTTPSTKKPKASSDSSS